MFHQTFSFEKRHLRLSLVGYSWGKNKTQHMHLREGAFTQRGGYRQLEIARDNIPRVAVCLCACLLFI